MSDVTPSDGGRAVDDLLAAFQMAVIAAHAAQNAVTPDEAHISRTAKERSILRNEIRGQLLAARSSAPTLPDAADRLIEPLLRDAAASGLGCPHCDFVAVDMPTLAAHMQPRCASPVSTPEQDAEALLDAFEVAVDDRRVDSSQGAEDAKNRIRAQLLARLRSPSGAPEAEAKR